MLKKITLILLFLLIPVFALSEIHGHFQAGKTLENEWAFAEIELQWWVGKGNLQNELYGGWQTWSQLRKGIQPFKDGYFIGNRIHYKGLYFEAEHWCTHAVQSYLNKTWWEENFNNNMNLTTFSIGVEW